MSSGRQEAGQAGKASPLPATAGSTLRQNELLSFVRYQLDKMGARNEHHRFEDLCRALARHRITRNILTATGPVSAGGDQGRDFETFTSYAQNNLRDVGVFTGIEEGQLMAFCCTIQSSGLPKKIRADMEKIFNSPGIAPSLVFYFTVADVTVSARHSLSAEAYKIWGARIEVIDGNSLSELLIDPECLWIASEYLQLSPQLLGSNGAIDVAGELTRTGDVIIRHIEDLDPIRDLGIHSPLCIDEWQGLPPYVKRAIDSRLDDLINRGGLVVVEGNSASGKTRTAFEAVLRSNIQPKNRRPVLIPKDGASLRKLIASGYPIENAIIWLDDLERFIGLGGLDEGIIRLFGSESGVLFIATLRSRAKAAMTQASGATGRSLANVYKAVMAGAGTVRVDRNLNKKERERAFRLAADLRIRSALEKSNSAGFAEFIAAAPSTLERWRDGQDGANEIGAALVSAAVDFRRAGYLSPIPKEWLEAVFKEYLDERIMNRLTPTELEEGFSWSVELVHGASSCMIVLGNDLYGPFDYLVDYTQGESENKTDGSSTFQSLTDIPDELWHELADRISLDDPNLMSCVSTASLSPHPGLQAVYRQAILQGSIPANSLNDAGALLSFARSCINAPMCIVCQSLRLGVPLRPLLQALLEEFGKIQEEDFPSDAQVGCVAALASLGGESGLENPDSPLREAADHFPTHQWRNVGEFMIRNSMDFEGRCWIAYADIQEGKKASWPVSLVKARGVLFREYDLPSGEIS
ncbi:hypothetical protein ACFYNN_11580 [Streptomyces sp. NPDC006978]|uniref:hypothetical protein n=1 Tax=Streptomyces sp. NPDC006978 TaxID=3364769 RepID=UPI00368394AA